MVDVGVEGDGGDVEGHAAVGAGFVLDEGSAGVGAEGDVGLAEAEADVVDFDGGEA